MNERNKFAQPLAQLQKDYRRAWTQFLKEVDSLQAAMNAHNPSQTAIDAQRSRVETASAAYRIARNALAAHLLECGVQVGEPLAVAGSHAA